MRHVKFIHETSQSFECNICHATFSCKGSLVHHIKVVHDNIKEFSCELCTYKTGQKGTLNMHVKVVHDNINEFSCELCCKNFGYKGSLVKHVQTVHENMKTIECNKCSRMFSHKKYLADHLKICTGKINMSSGEFSVKKVLDDMMIDYTYDSCHDHLTRFCGKHLRFDFFIHIEGYDPVVIEYNGKQHYVPKTFGGISKERAMENYHTQQKNDQFKRDFCIQNGYKMLEISYKDYGKINQLVSNYMIESIGWGEEYIDGL